MAFKDVPNLLVFVEVLGEEHLDFLYGTFRSQQPSKRLVAKSDVATRDENPVQKQ